MSNNSEYSHRIEQIMSSAMTKLKAIIDVNTVIGTPLTTKDGATIIPISKVTVGFVAGGGEYSSNLPQKKNVTRDYPFAGGSGSGFNISPVGFLIKENDVYRMIDIETDGTTASLFELVGKIVSGFTAKTKNEEEEEDE